MENNNQPYRILAFKDFVPERARFWILLFFVVIFQFSSGIYFSLSTQMTGSLSLLHEDVMMTGYATFVGMSITFPILFRLKFRFTTKTILAITATGLILCNIIMITSSSVPLLIGTAFISGILRIWGFFECISTIQLKITPTRDFAVFFPVLYLIILGSVQLSAILAGYVAYCFGWQHMNVLIIALLLGIILFSFFLLKNIHLAPKQNLSGIDWVGGILWSLFLLFVIYAFTYAEYYDWADSSHIFITSLFALAFLAYVVIRSRSMEHPFINLKAFSHRHVVTIMFLFLLWTLLAAPSSTLQNIFTGEILHYSSLTSLSLNWAVLGGVLGGSAVSYYLFAKRGVGYKRMTIASFVCIVLHLIIMYFLISPDTSRKQLILPFFLRGAGTAILYITLTLYGSRTIPFMAFFHVLALFGFIRSGIGSPINNALFENLFSAANAQNVMVLGAELDPQNPIISSLPFNALLAELHRQTTLVSLKELYGYASTAGVIILILALCARYSKYPKLKMPTTFFSREFQINKQSGNKK